MRLAALPKVTVPAMLVAIFPATLATVTDALFRVGPPRPIDKVRALRDQLFESLNVPESCTWVEMMVTVPEILVTGEAPASVMVTLAPLIDNDPKEKVLVDAVSDQLRESV